MKNIHSIQIKIKIKQTTNSDCSNINSVITEIDNVLNCKNEYRTIEIHDSIDIDGLKKVLAEKFDLSSDNFRDGCLQGRYGSNTGNYDNGITVSIDADHFVDRYIDCDNDEVVNPIHLLDDCGAELVEDLDGDIFAESCEDLGLKVISDNTYNYAGHSELPYFLFGFDFKLIENEQSQVVYMAIMFHHGGDTRGNYGSRYVFKFKTIDDAYSFIAPYCMLKEVI